MIRIYKVTHPAYSLELDVETPSGLILRVYGPRLRWLQGRNWKTERSFLERVHKCTVTEVHQGDKHVLHRYDKGNTGRR